MIPRLAAMILMMTAFAGVARGQGPEVARMAYAVYAAGLNILTIDATAEIGPRGYRIDLSYRTTGMLGTFFPSTIESFAEGGWAAAGPAPARFTTSGTARGKVRRSVIEFVAGQPVVRTLEPLLEEDREPVAPEWQRDAIDTLSAMAFLLRQVAQAGTCDGKARLFDGRRVMEVASRTAGRDVLRPDFRSSFAGPALRCDFTGRQLSGFMRDLDAEERAREHPSRVWMPPAAGRLALPVRIEFEARFFGKATAYATAL